MSLPYYKRYPRDFLEGTIGLSFEEKGAYAVVLDLIYMRDGRLADDARYIAGQLGCSVRKWNTVRASLVEKRKLVVELGFISNFRANYLLEETRKYQDQQAENRRVNNENSGLENRSSHQPEPEPEPVESGGVVIAFEREAPEKPEAQTDWPDKSQIVEVLHGVSGPGLGDRSKTPGLIQTSGVIVSWRQGGCSWELDVLPTVRALTAKARGSPISTWAYFSNAVVRARDQRLKPLPEPQFVEPRHEPANRQDAKREQLESALRRRLAAGLGASER